MTKEKKSVSPQLQIRNEMIGFDQKDRAYYDKLTDEDKKKFSPFLLMKYGASVDGSADYQAWYLRATNERVNQNFFDISTTEHKKLQWLLCTTVSPKLGNQYHYWLASRRENNNKAKKFLKQIYPVAKEDEIDLLSKLNDKDDLKDLARKHGWSEQQIKHEL